MAQAPVRNLAIVISAMAGLIAGFQPSVLHAQIRAPAARAIPRTMVSNVLPVADMSSQYVRPGTVQPGAAGLDKKKGKFEFFDVDTLAGMAAGTITTGIVNQRRRDSNRQDFFYAGRPYYGGHYYGGPAYYGGPYFTYYLKQ